VRAASRACALALLAAAVLAAPPAAAASGSARDLTGMVALVLVVAIGIGLLIHAAFLHLAATVVLDQPRFTQAIVAGAISMGVVVVAAVFRLPPVLSGPVLAFGSFAALKISYGASIPRTLALMFVSLLIAVAAGFATAAIFR
jgi:hypothetical protein